MEAKPGNYTYLVAATNEEAKVVTSYVCTVGVYYYRREWFVDADMLLLLDNFGATICDRFGCLLPIRRGKGLCFQLFLLRPSCH
jgi:hypothetical protein